MHELIYIIEIEKALLQRNIQRSKQLHLWETFVSN